MKYTQYIILPLAALAACAYVPSQDLLAARSAYDIAAQGPAAALTPSDLHKAKVALDRAERFDRADQGSLYAKDQAYIAVRKAEWAQARAATAQADKQFMQAEQRFQQEQGTQLNAARQMTHSQGEALASQSKDLVVERQRTADAAALAVDAEKREKEAMDRLATAEKLSSDARGQVITLSSGLLFKTNQAILLPGAFRRLNQVAEALKMVPNRAFLIEGHTDSIGNEENNMTLSERRANAVRSYLVSQGVDGSKVQTVGAGKSRPIADNASTEGRAMNRRVEIVVLKGDPQTATK